MNTNLNNIENWPELAREAKWSASGLARKSGVSLRTLERHLLKHMGQNPRTWLTKQRQECAVGLLRNGNSVKEVAERVGYRHASTFSREFTRHSGCRPKEMMPPFKSLSDLGC